MPAALTRTRSGRGGVTASVNEVVIGCHPSSSTVRRGSTTSDERTEPEKNARKRASYFTLLQPPNLAEFCSNLQPPRGHVTAIRRHCTLRLLFALRAMLSARMLTKLGPRYDGASLIINSAPLIIIYLS